MDNMESAKAYVGQTLDGRYNIIDCVGIGGMAYVLKAHDTLMNRTVAIKILNDSSNSDAAAVRRFVNESKAVAMLSSPHIVSIYDVAFESNPKYIVMEYIDGITLKEYMRKHGKLDCMQAVEFTEQILLGLEHAHAKGVIHRDIKPQNIMLLSNGLIKVADFGIAKIPTGDTIRFADKAMGTVYYISPEQASGKPTGHYTDIYSVGIMLYEMVTGKLPFDGDTPVTIAMKQIKEQPVPPSQIDSSVPKGLEQIIMKAINKNPSDRFKSARSMLRAINIFKNNPNVIFDSTPKKSESKTDNTAQDESTAQVPKRKKRDIAEKTERTANKTKVKVDKDSKQYTKPRRSMFPIILGVTMAIITVVAILGIYFVVTYAGLNSSDTSFTITIPKIVGETYNDELAARLKANHCVVTDVEYVYKNDIESGIIIEQTPAADSSRKLSNENSTIKMQLVVSKGKKSLTVPDVNYYDAKTAEKMLTDVGLKVETVEKYDEYIEKGYVISTEPEKGNNVNAGDTVKIYVCSGIQPKEISMINLVGYTLDEAKQRLKENGLLLGNVTEKESDGDENLVIMQSIKSGEKVMQGQDKVDITVSINKTTTTKQTTTESAVSDTTKAETSAVTTETGEN
ncbi:MAG: Stk1 family PASTA domain-containing Ser/Thr kinase [Firmicutes bacterium]|nr:Stk1 family PASTA domain-containing Ser/Thr kinase [Bacillota bacterium]